MVFRTIEPRMLEQLMKGVKGRMRVIGSRMPPVISRSTIVRLANTSNLGPCWALRRRLLPEMLDEAV